MAGSAHTLCCAWPKRLRANVNEVMAVRGVTAVAVRHSVLRTSLAATAAGFATHGKRRTASPMQVNAACSLA
jgi:hypothetical protein